MTNEELIQKYRSIYKKKTGKDMSDEMAWDQAMKLVTLVDAVCGPVTKVKKRFFLKR